VSPMSNSRRHAPPFAGLCKGYQRLEIKEFASHLVGR
jgi:hypothetical protein